MKTFNLNEALNGKKVITRGGAKVKIITTSRNRIIANVYPIHNIGNPEQMSFKMNGMKYSEENPTFWDLMMAV